MSGRVGRTAAGGRERPPVRRLLLSIHDVGPRFEREIDILHNLLRGLVGDAPLAMLVVPDHWNEAPLARAPAFAARLRRWSDAGVEMFVHGWCHRHRGAHRGLAGWKGRHMTAGEGEFLGLDHAEALARMRAGKALVEDIIGRPSAGFIAPAWLYGVGARRALAEAGFVCAEDHLRVWRPGDGAVLARGPVITWASRSPARIASSLAVASVARSLHPLIRNLRVAVHPGDTGEPRLLASIAATITAVRTNRIIARYADLEGGSIQPQPAAPRAQVRVAA